jgi:tetratricopeptide (TPR) repeat protein
VSPLVDEIVVVDTGSTDTSRRIARERGARLYSFAWADDFAAARNHGLARARGRWILYIDADEWVRPADAARLRAQLADPALVACYVLLHPQIDFTPYWELRLFRNDPRIRFRGVIHENIWPGVEAYRAAEGGRIGRSRLVFDHEGYEGDQSAKHRRDLPLLRRRLRDDPTAVYCRCHLADIHAARGEGRLAVRAWTAALEVVRGKTQRRPEDSLPYIGLVQWRLGHGGPVEALLTEALAGFPGNLYLQWLRASALMRARRFAEAVPVLEQLIKTGRGGSFERAMAYDRRLFGAQAPGALATCHWNLGNLALSRRWFERAAASEPGAIEYRVKAAISHRRDRASPRATSEMAPRPLPPTPRRDRASPRRPDGCSRRAAIMLGFAKSAASTKPSRGRAKSVPFGASR